MIYQQLSLLIIGKIKHFLYDVVAKLVSHHQQQWCCDRTINNSQLFGTRRGYSVGSNISPTYFANQSATVYDAAENKTFFNLNDALSKFLDSNTNTQTL